MIQQRKQQSWRSCVVNRARAEPVCLTCSRITFYGPLNKIMTQEEMELKSGFVTSQLIGLPATQEVAISCSHLWYSTWMDGLCSDLSLWWSPPANIGVLCYSEVKEIRSMSCGDDDLRDFLLLVYWCIPLRSTTALCQSKGCYVLPLQHSRAKKWPGDYRGKWGSTVEREA